MLTTTVVDIETLALDGAAEYITKPARGKSLEETIEMSSLDPDLCRILAIGIAQPPKPPVAVVLADEDAEEKALRRLGRVFADTLNDKGSIVGYNLIDFDLPVLMRRALYLDVPFPSLPVDRYRHHGVHDLMQILSWNGKLKYKSLDFYVKRFGILCPVSDGISGAEIAAQFAAGNLGAVEQHVLADVWKTALLAERLGYAEPINTVRE